MRSNNPLISHRTESALHHLRLNILVTLVIICSLFLVLRLAYLQFSQYKRFATLSLQNQMSITPIAPTRGIIVDRNNVVLAENIPTYALEIVPEHVENIQSTLQQLKQLLPSITDDDIEHFHRTRKQTRRYLPVPFKLKLNEEEVAIFATHKYAFPGVSIHAQLMRSYPLGDVASHLLGYVGRINADEQKQIESTNYRATHFIGKTGIERFYEYKLHGRVGYQHVETDVSGRTVRVLSKQAPVSGAKLQLTIDARLQTRAHQALKGKEGAVAVIDVRDGSILAMVSVPSYDPNLFVHGITHKAYEKLVNAPEKPLYNRAIRGLYPPASTIKPFIALAGLEKEVITEDTKIFDPGWYRLPGVSHTYRDWKRGGHGSMHLKRAITVSCDTYFYHLGNKLGISAMEDMLVRFGFGQLTHVDLKEEIPGLVPNPQWKRQTRGVSWYTGDTLITAIGQGSMLATPLQLANATASLSQRGRRFRPHLLQQWTDDQKKPKSFIPLEEYPIYLKDDKSWDLITDAMQSVIKSREGTGYRFGRKTDYSVAAKTGTSQVIAMSQDEKKRFQSVSAAFRDHSLFIAFAPVEKPEIAIAVLVEHDPTASNIARQIMDAYFGFKKHEVTS